MKLPFSPSRVPGSVRRRKLCSIARKRLEARTKPPQSTPSDALPIAVEFGSRDLAAGERAPALAAGLSMALPPGGRLALFSPEDRRAAGGDEESVPAARCGRSPSFTTGAAGPSKTADSRAGPGPAGRSCQASWQNAE